VTLTESIAAMKQVTAATVPRLLPYLEAGLAPGASSEQFAGAIIVSVQLALKAQLAQPLTEALMEGLAKGARAPLHAQVLQALLVLCQVRSIHWSPYDRVGAVNADPEGLCPAHLSAHPSLSIPALGAFQLRF
jgi:U3 small nucleolar RNA-associated protein 10